ncbi:MAG: alpha/beta fold hydrolase, partial [Gammaproteobacteria bacterium]
VGRAFGGRIASCLAADSPADVLSVTAIAAGGRYAGGARPRPGNGAHALEPPRFKVWRAAGAAQRRAAASTPLDDWWSGGRAPMLVVQGLEDTIAPPQNGRALHLADPDRVRLVEVPDAGHGVLFERPDVVVPAVLEFLRAVEAARGSPSSR